MALHLEQMTADELKQLNRDRTLIFIPVAALEDFGPHLPLAHGLNEATYFCEQTAVNFEGKYQGWNCVIAPRAPIGISTQTTEVSLVSRGHVLRDWLVDFCLQLNRVGFSYFVCVTGSLTPRQLTAIDDAAKQISRRARYRLIKTRPKLLSASTVQLQKSEVYRSPFWPDAWEHGGELDTSVALAIDPNEVRPIYSELKQIVRPVGFFERLLLRVRGKRSGYWGAPQMATQKKGAELIESRVQALVPKLFEAIESNSYRKLFKNGYSLFPSNGTFFKSWGLALGATLFLILWVLLLVQSFTS